MTSLYLHYLYHFFHVPPFDIQKRIVDRLDKIRDYVKEINRLQEQLEIYAITDTVLDKAFKGKFVPRNPDD
jgi:restriction endonuclease S subunit